MRELILACMNLAVQILIFLSLGSLMVKIFRMKMDVSMALILGYIFYFSILGIIMVPLTLLWTPLSTTSICWAVVLVAGVGIALVIYRKYWLKSILELKNIISSHGIALFCVGAMVGLQCALVILYQDTTIDAAYYVGQVSTSVYTDTLQRYDPYTGAILKKFSARYMFSSYPMHNAIWCYLTGIHAMVQSKMVMGVINVLVANAALYQVGKRLFGDVRKADFMVCVAAILQLFSYTIYTPGTFFFTRVYEGKAILANISLVLVFYCAVWFWQDHMDRRMWGMLLLVNISAITFSGSAIFMPAAVSAAVLPVMILKKKFREIVHYVIVMLPSFLYAAAYIGTKFGWWIFKAS